MACITDAADSREIACSPERPPNRIPTRSRFFINPFAPEDCGLLAKKRSSQSLRRAEKNQKSVACDEQGSIRCPDYFCPSFVAFHSLLPQGLLAVSPNLPKRARNH